MRQGIAGAIVLSSVLFASPPARALHPEAAWVYFVLGPLMWIAFFGVVIVLVVLAIRRFGGGTFMPPGKMPLNILQERFARGEIDTEEFEERRRVLGG